MSRIIAAVDALTDALGRVIAWLTFGMVAVTMIVVTLRYGFDTGAVRMQESVTYMHALVFMLGIPYALKHGAHVRVDLVHSRVGPRTQELIDLCGHILLLTPVAIYILLSSLDYVVASWRVREASAEVGGLPAVFLLKSLIPLMAGLLLLQGWAESLRIILNLRPRPVG
ncbi:MAG: TRAP transporter small permease subunit [Gammaproteobacteria bacterium]|nr:TRAP transporter small permease subunit [Gammaproteobacteria bacterium]